MSLRGNIDSLQALSATLRTLPRVVGQKIAAAAAPELTAAARATFNASEDAFGANWLPGVHGQRVTLKKGGDLAKYIKYVAIGTKLRVSLGVRYAKYQVGRRPIFPKQGEALPTAYVRALQSVTREILRIELGGGP